MVASLSTNLSFAENANLESFAEGRCAPLCFHCGLEIPAGAEFSVTIDGVDQPMCCPGCSAVAEAIVAAGHAGFYRVRTAASSSARDLVPGLLRDAEIYDSEPLQRHFVRSLDDAKRETSLILEGITCAACVWLIEQHLAGLPGIEDVHVNYATQRAWVTWDETRIRLSDILRAIHAIGYRGLPYDPERQQAAYQRDRRRQQRRLAVAGLFGMQVMMLSISLYAGAWSGIERGFEQLFRWLCLGLTLPVVFYAAPPFFVGAWRDLKQRRVGMDLPVSLAIGIAFASSLAATLSGRGEIYFDSVVMFIFFLTASRYFEAIARQRCAYTVEKLVQAMPLTATRLDEAGQTEETLPAAQLAVGDRILLRPGETVPADGIILHGISAFDEALLSGESTALNKQPGAAVLGGSINLLHPVQLRVTAVGVDTVMSEIQRMIERAQADKPPLAQLADRVASRFIVVLLIAVGATALYWYLQHGEHWFETALAVLIVACPCALSLATPTAISASLGQMQAAGLLVKHGAALEALSEISHVVFDKTGTLTCGLPVLTRLLCRAGADRADCLEIALALERHSEHPLARALCEEYPSRAPRTVDDLENVAGGGLRGRIDGVEYYIGSADFIASRTLASMPTEWLERGDDAGETEVVLACADKVLALFCFSDRVRDDAAALVTQLQARGKQVLLMSGDRAAAVRQVALTTGIDEWRAEQSPRQKMAAVQALQMRGARVLMVGDGINDAPVLARADLSIAVAGASALARTSADIVLLANRLKLINELFERAARTRRVIRQNLSWALAYNLSAIPAAAAGLVAPWLAAAGMSLSSLVVVLNALRLSR